MIDWLLSPGTLVKLAASPMEMDDWILDDHPIDMMLMIQEARGGIVSSCPSIVHFSNIA